MISPKNENAGIKLPQRLDNLSYFHRWLHREDTPDVLIENGDFLLRKAKGADGKTEKLVVSVLWLEEIRHFPIQKTDKERYCFEGRAFRMVKDLIQWHQTHHEPLTEESGAILKKAKPMLEWELLTAQLQLETEAIAWGQYGDVCEGKVMLRKDATERMVAVKSIVFEKDPVDSILNEARDRILVEARSLREVADHQNIVKFYGIAVDHFRPMLAVELMSGNLEERLREKPSISLETKRKLMLMAIGGLAHIHCHGLIHRNICAKNCLVLTTANAEPVNLKLSGFDLCVRCGDSENSFFNGGAFPTSLNPTICAPESLLGNIWMKCSDVWSFAVFIYELYTNGALPYSAELAKVTGANRVKKLALLLNGGSRLCVPSSAPNEIKSKWSVMFEQNDKLRPSAFELLESVSSTGSPVSSE